MGQKTNPIGLRVAVNKDWRSKWFANKKEFAQLLTEDREIRESCWKSAPKLPPVPKILITRDEPLPRDDGLPARAWSLQGRGN